MEAHETLENENGIVVIADYREREVIQFLKKLGAKVNETNLKVGDFVVSERIVVERKDHSDFVSSIIDGRIFDQSDNMKENFSKSIVIIEGHSNRDITENALKATMASLMVNYDMSLVHSRNAADTAKIIFWVAKKEQEESMQHMAFKVGKKPKDVKRLQEEIVASLPGISGVLSKRLLEHLGSIEKIFSASEEKLAEVKGISEKLAKRIKEISGKVYG